LLRCASRRWTRGYAGRPCRSCTCGRTPITPPTDGSFRGESAKARAEEAWYDILRAALDIAPDVEIISEHVAGYAQSVLLKASEGAALLVVGSRGLGGWTGLMLGSVSLHCITQSACPVAVIRAPATAPDSSDTRG
jgi:nucleotide-binding universal stress UspA family protein